MMTLTPAFAAEKNKPAGTRPLDVLKVKFSTGDLYVGIADVTIPNWGGGDRAVRGWVQEFGRVDDVIAPPLDDSPILTGDMSIRLLAQDGQDGADTFWTRLNDPVNKPEQTVAELYLWFIGLDAATSPPMKRWAGMIKNWRWHDEMTLDVELGDSAELIDQPLGRLVTRATFPNADPDAVGSIEPIVYGAVRSVPCRAIDAGPNSPLSLDLSAAAAALHYSQFGTTFAAAGQVYVDQEQITYTGKTTETLNGVTHGKLTGLTRGVNGTTAGAHARGDVVIQIQTAYSYLVAGHPCKAVKALYAKDSQGKLVLIPGQDYAANISNTSFADGVARTTVGFTVLPKLIKQVNLTHTDTISNSDTIGATSSPITTTETQFGDGAFPRNQSSPFYPGMTLVTFPGLPAGATFVRQTVTVAVNYSATQINSFQTMHGFISCGDATSDVIKPLDNKTLQLNSTTLANNVTTSFVAAGFNSPDTAGNLVVGSASRTITYTIQPTITKTGAVTSAGAGTLTGNSAADVVVGAELYADVEGYADDASGTYTGTALALIQKPADVIRHLLVTWMALPLADFETSANLAATMGATYQINGPILSLQSGKRISSRMAFECGCRLKFEAGRARLTLLERTLSPAAVLTTHELHFLAGARKSADVQLVGLDQIVNVIDVLFDRDWSLGAAAGQADAYRGISRAVNAWSQSQYGERGRTDGKFHLDFVTTQAHADAVRATWMDLYAIRRSLVTVRTALDGFALQNGDVVTVRDRTAGKITGIVISADYQPGDPTRLPACDLTVLAIQEGEAMLKVSSKISDYALISPADERTIFTNTGAPGAVTMTLPPAAPGMEFGPFVVAAGFSLRVMAAGTNVLTTSFVSGSATSPVGSVAAADQAVGLGLSSSTIGAYLSVVCITSGKWLVREKIGNWAVG